MIIEKHENNVFITCTEREARQIANALAFQTDAYAKMCASVHTPNQLFKMSDHHYKTHEAWAKEIFERVGY